MGGNPAPKPPIILVMAPSSLASSPSLSLPSGERVLLCPKKGGRTYSLRYDETRGLFLFRFPKGLPESLWHPALERLMARYKGRYPEETWKRKRETGDTLLLFGKREKVPGLSLMADGSKERYLERRLREYLSQAVPLWAGKMGTKGERAIKIGPYRSQFGSNNARDGSLSFALSLVHYPEHVIDSVVAHELAHDFRRDHGPLFYKKLLAHFPDYWECRRRLLKRDCLKEDEDGTDR